MAVSLRQLNERRADLARQMRAIVDAAGDTAEDGAAGLTPEQQKAFDALKAALMTLESAIANRTAVDDAERRMPGLHVAGGAESGELAWEREVRGFSVVRAIAGACGIPGIDAGREREISTELARRSGRQPQGILIPNESLFIERRVITTTTPTGLAGGNVIGTFLDGGQWIDPLRSALVIRQLGARVLDGLVSNIDLPRLAQPAAAGWFAENTAMPQSDTGFDKVPLRAKHAGGLVELSRNVLIQASAAIEDIIRSDLAAVLARVIDAAAISGTGLAEDPVGLMNYPGVPQLAVGAAGGPITWQLVNLMVATVSQNNASEDGRGFLTNALVRGHAMTTPKSGTMPLGFVQDAPGMMVGYPQMVTSLVPSNGVKTTGTGLSTLAYGVWSDCLIGIWGNGIELLVNPFADSVFSKANVQVRAVVTCDVQFRHPKSFAFCADIAAPAVLP